MLRNGLETSGVLIVQRVEVENYLFGFFLVRAKRYLKQTLNKPHLPKQPSSDLYQSSQF
jgi:hypothetical protein